MTANTHKLDRSIFIHAKPDTVFGFFQDNARWASWWGAGSTMGSSYCRPQADGATSRAVELVWGR